MDTRYLYPFSPGSGPSYFVQEQFVYEMSGSPAFFIDDDTLYTMTGKPTYWISEGTVYDYSRPAKAVFYFA